MFGPTLRLSTCAKCGEREEHPTHGPLAVPAGHAFVPKFIPTRWVGEQHVMEDLGCIPTLADWLTRIASEPWMNRARRLSQELERDDPRILEGKEKDS